MSDGNQGSVRGSSLGGVSGQHPDSDSIQLYPAPSTSDEFNKARLNLIPVACWRVHDIRFAFDSSFVAPEIATELQDLRNLVQDYPGCPLSIFGHADPVGSDDYNKALSGRRATAIYALLLCNSDPSTAVSLWQKISNTENWGDDQQQAMQSTTGLPDGTPNASLFQAYMQKLCPQDLALSKQDFLAQGSDSGGKGDYQGCSEFNPSFIFSDEMNSEFNQDQDKTERNAANAPNRRVVVLLFRKGSKVTPAKWPCPRATDGTAGCRKRFWSDGEARRSNRLPDQARKYEDTHDTFACRFYDRLLSGSPCEKANELWVVRILAEGMGPLSQRKPLANEQYVLTGSGSPLPEIRGITDPQGILSVAVTDQTPTMTLSIAGTRVLLKGGTLLGIRGGDDAVKARLFNLGYGPSSLGAWDDDDLSAALKQFQKDYSLQESGTADDDTLNKLREVHGS